MRKFIFAFLFLLVGLSYIFKIDELLIKKFSFLSDIKTIYMVKMMNFSTILEKYFDQANSIEKLKTENNELKEYKILYTSTQNQ
jgi:rod shape-determining protein MreC